MEVNSIGLSNDAFAASARRSVGEKRATEVGGGRLAGPERIKAKLARARAATEQSKVAGRMAYLAMFGLVSSRKVSHLVRAFEAESGW